MKRFIFGFIAVLCVLALLVYTGITQSNTDDLLLKYKRQAPFSEYEMTYHYLGKPWFGKGLIFYRPQFPTLSLKQTTDRVKVILTPFEKTFYFSGLTLHIAETLQGRKDLLQSLKSFQTPDDFLTKPLEGLALLGFDTFRGDIQITIREQQGITLLTCQVFHRKHLILEAQTTLLSTPDNRLFGWVNTPFQMVKTTIYSPLILKRIVDYYRSLGQDLPLSLKQAINRQEPLVLAFNLLHPESISSLMKGQP